MKKTILLTFDYELFLGSRSGSVDNCLIKPTGKILEILKQNHAQAIFFIDTTYLFRLQKLSETNANAERDFNIIKRQLVQMASAGHYLYHHLHPHWLDAQYLEDINQWDLSDTGRYCFVSLSDSDKDLLFKYADSFLTDIYAKAQSENTCNGFRAGGLYIEPFICFKPFFEKYGIKYEFSVVPGGKKTGEKLFCDFTSCPAERPYPFNENPELETLEGEFTEFPITKISIKGIAKILNSMYYRANKLTKKNNPYGDGISVGLDIIATSAKRSIKNYLILDMTLSTELLNPVLFYLFKRIIKKNKYIHFLSHPKLQTEIGLKTFDRLLKHCNREFSIDYDFIRFNWVNQKIV